MATTCQYKTKNVCASMINFDLEGNVVKNVSFQGGCNGNLKAISKFRYIGHKELRVEKSQFDNMLRDLLSAGLIEPNNLSNCYGANAYDVTDKGALLVHKTDKTAKKELITTISEAVGTFTGAVLSQIYDVA